jgi:CRP-like cAMP-binding protein
LNNWIKDTAFDPVASLAKAGFGSQQIDLQPQETFFCQGDPGDAIFYLEGGQAKLTAVSERGKEATIMFYSPGDFIGAGALTGIVGPRMATASAVNTCIAIKIMRDEMDRVMHDDPQFCDFFMKFMLAKSLRTHADLLNQLFNPSEKCLARVLLLMAVLGKPGEEATFIPPVSQETLAEMIGSTRSRVSFFMNRFSALGLVSYNGRILVHKALLNVVLLDQLPGCNPQRPALPVMGPILKPILPIVEVLLKPVVPILAMILKPVKPIAGVIKRKLAVGAGGVLPPEPVKPNLEA